MCAGHAPAVQAAAAAAAAAATAAAAAATAEQNEPDEADELNIMQAVMVLAAVLPEAIELPLLALMEAFMQHDLDCDPRVSEAGLSCCSPTGSAAGIKLE